MLRLRAVSERLARGRSALYDDVAAGLITPPVKMGGRAVAWPEHEVQAVAAARAAGLQKTEIQGLVSRLIEGRKTRFAATLQVLGLAANARK